MKKEFGQLSHWWDGNFNKIKGWYCSRKFNGWSALWDGGVTRGIMSNEIPWFKKDKTVLSTGLWSLGRNNNPDVIYAPEDFLNSLPKGIPLHGELWYHDRLDIIKKTCGTKKWIEPMWGNIRFKIFNIKPFNKWFNNPIFLSDRIHQRLSLIKTEYTDINNYKKTIELLKKLEYNDVLDYVSVIKLNSIKELKDLQAQVIKNKWEGLIFCNPDGKYECGRSHHCLKWKPECENEATIIGYEKGKTGKNIGKIASLKAELVWDEQILCLFGGATFMVNKKVNFNISGLNDEERDIETCKEKYKIGNKVPFTFLGVSIHGIPQSCNLHREVK